MHFIKMVYKERIAPLVSIKITDMAEHTKWATSTIWLLSEIREK